MEDERKFSRRDVGREVSAISSVRARNEVKIKWPLNLAIQKP